MTTVKCRFTVGCWHAGRPISLGEELDLTPRDALYAVGGGRALPLDRAAYVAAIAELNAEVLRHSRGPAWLAPGGRR